MLPVIIVVCLPEVGHFRVVSAASLLLLTIWGSGPAFPSRLDKHFSHFSGSVSVLHVRSRPLIHLGVHCRERRKFEVCFSLHFHPLAPFSPEPCDLNC